VQAGDAVGGADEKEVGYGLGSAAVGAEGGRREFEPVKVLILGEYRIPMASLISFLCLSSRPHNDGLALLHIEALTLLSARH
jgi:hypothetical protein